MFFEQKIAFQTTFKNIWLKILLVKNEIRSSIKLNIIKNDLLLSKKEIPFSSYDQ